MQAQLVPRRADIMTISNSENAALTNLSLGLDRARTVA